MTLQPTTWQTVGPFFSIGLGRLTQSSLANPNTEGEHIEIQGRVLDGELCPVPDALLEIWQADAHGRYPRHDESRDESPNQSQVLSFRGFGRIPTDDKGRFQFKTIKPGAVPAPDGGLQAPHLVVGLVLRGLLKRLVTRIYFPEEVMNRSDTILHLIPAARQSTLFLKTSDTEPRLFTWDIQLQGQNETVFLEF